MGAGGHGAAVGSQQWEGLVWAGVAEQAGPRPGVSGGSRVLPGARAARKGACGGGAAGEGRREG